MQAAKRLVKQRHCPVVLPQVRGVAGTHVTLNDRGGGGEGGERRQLWDARHALLRVDGVKTLALDKDAAAAAMCAHHLDVRSLRAAVVKAVREINLRLAAPGAPDEGIPTPEDPVVPARVMGKRVHSHIAERIHAGYVAARV
jgi:hypothetical protein